MTYLILILSVILFIELFIALHIIKDTSSVIKLAGDSMSIVKSKEMSDLEKEKFMRKNSLVLMLSTFKFMAKFLIVIVVVSLFVWGALLIYPELTDSIVTGFTSVMPLLVLTVVAGIYTWGRNVIRKKL